MTITCQQFTPTRLSADAVALFFTQDTDAFNAQANSAQELWGATAAVFASKDFTGAKDSSAVVYTGDAKLQRVILIGLGEAAKVDAERIRRAAATAAQRGAAFKAAHLALLVPTVNQLAPEAVAEALVEGTGLVNYAYDKFITSREPKKKLGKLTLLAEDKGTLKNLKRGTASGQAIVNGALFARDLSNAPSNELYPEALAKEAKKLAAQGVKVTVLDKKQIEKHKMGGLLAVNQGSVRPPFFIIMEWNGGKKGGKPIVLVGKGITFDSGGISLKPGAGMGEMKMDMGGSAAVIGAMRGIAEMKLPRNVVALVPTTENMPSGSAYKPGDVITLMNGKTAEIDNTDAEGRLILADALTYADKYKPQAVLDLATLTGACMIAVGHHAIGLMGNNDELKAKVAEAGNRSYERTVELPLWEEYEDQIKSDVANVKNTGGRPAGAITAGLFLQHFIGDYPWAHLDIAGSAMVPKGYGYINRGGTGSGARLLIDLIRNWN